MKNLQNITLAEAKKLFVGDIIYSKRFKNSDGTPARFKVNGQVKTWKRNPNRVQVPLKRGLYEFGYITEHNLSEFGIFVEMKRELKKRDLYVVGMKVRSKKPFKLLVGERGKGPWTEYKDFKKGTIGAIESIWSYGRLGIHWNGLPDGDVRVMDAKDITIIKVS